MSFDVTDIPPLVSTATIEIDLVPKLKDSLVVCICVLSEHEEGALSKEESRGFAVTTELGGGGCADCSGCIEPKSELSIVFLALRLFRLDWQGIDAGSTDLGELMGLEVISFGERDSIDSTPLSDSKWWNDCEKGCLLGRDVREDFSDVIDGSERERVEGMLDWRDLLFFLRFWPEGGLGGGKQG